MYIHFLISFVLIALFLIWCHKKGWKVTIGGWAERLSGHRNATTPSSRRLLLLFESAASCCRMSERVKSSWQVFFFLLWKIFLLHRPEAKCLLKHKDGSWEMPFSDSSSPVDELPNSPRTQTYLCSIDRDRSQEMMLTVHVQRFSMLTRLKTQTFTFLGFIPQMVNISNVWGSTNTASV